MEQNLIDSIVKSYSFVWFRGVRGRHAERRLERMMQRYPRSADAIPNLRAFKGGYGMIVCRDYIPTLQSIMSQIFRRSRMDLEYPSSDRNFDSRYWGYPSPNGLYSAWFHKLGTCTSEIAIALNEYANSTSFDSQASSNRDIYGGRTYSFLVDESSFQRNFFPDDEREKEHQAALNRIWLHFDKAPFLAPITSEEAHVLDIGCGSGAWAFHIADNHPHWQIRGYDVSRIIPSLQPPNCVLYIDDCNIPRPDDRNCFDFIHVRGMSLCVDDWPSLIHRCHQALKSGGYLEVKDVIPTPRRYSGSIAIPVCKEWGTLMKDSAMRHNRDLLATNKIGKLMRRQGFREISEVTKEWPLQDSKSKRIFIEEAQGLSHSLLPCSSERVEMYLVELRKELQRSQTYLQAVTIYGRKPD